MGELHGAAPRRAAWPARPARRRRVRAPARQDAALDGGRVLCDARLGAVQRRAGGAREAGEGRALSGRASVGRRGEERG